MDSKSVYNPNGRYRRRLYQLLGLLYRHCLFIRKAPISTLLDFLIPLCIVLLIWLPRQLVPVVTVPKTNYSSPKYSTCLFGLYGPQFTTILKALDLKTKTFLEGRLTVEEVLCQNYDPKSFFASKKHSSKLTSDIINVFHPSLIELFPKLPKRKYNGKTLLTLIERMSQRPLYLIDGLHGSCTRLKESLDAIFEAMLGETSRDPDCSCLNSSSLITDCCPEVNINIYPSVIHSPYKPNHPVLEKDSMLVAMAVIVCEKTDYKESQFQFDIRMSRATESIGITTGSFIQYDNTVDIHDPIPPSHYVAGLFKPPSQIYNGGFLDLQTLIHLHLLNASTPFSFSPNMISQKTNDKDNDSHNLIQQFTESLPADKLMRTVLTPEESFLIFGRNGLRSEIWPLDWPPASLFSEEDKTDWDSVNIESIVALVDVLQTMCLICHQQQIRFQSMKDKLFCYRARYAASMLLPTGIVDQLLQETTLQPYYTFYLAESISLCDTNRISEIIWNLDLPFSMSFPLVGFLLKELDTWVLQTTKNLREALTVTSYYESGYPNVKGSYDFFAMILVRVGIWSVVWAALFVSCVWKLIRGISSDREAGLEEYFRIMGVSSTTLWLSWYLFTAIYYSLIYICVSFAASNLFGATSVLVIFLLFCYIAGVVGVATFCSAACFYTGIQVSGVQISSNIQLLIMILYPVATSTGVTQLAGFSFFAPDGTSRGISFTQIRKSFFGSSTLEAYCMLIFDTILYFCLAWYIEHLKPGPYGVPKPCHKKNNRCNNYTSTNDRLQHYAQSISRSQFIHPKILSKRRLSHSQEELNTFESGSIEMPLIYLSNVTKEFMCETQQLHSPFFLRLFSFCQRRKYRRLVAVEDVSLTVYKNEIFGLIGRNGAGKTTLLKILNGILAPTSGIAFVGEQIIKSDSCQFRDTIAFCPQNDILCDRLSILEHLKFFGFLRGLPLKLIHAQATVILSQLKLTSEQYTNVNKLSGGKRRRVMVAAALMGNPKILLLDEPSAGLDLMARRSLRDTLRIACQGRATILITHHLDDAEALCTQIGIIDKGQLLAMGTPYYLKSSVGQLGYTLTIISKKKLITDKDLYSSYGIVGIVFHHVPNARFISRARFEFRFCIPLQDVQCLAKLLHALEQASIEADNEMILPFIIPKRLSTTSSPDISYPLNYSIKSFSLALPTLEDVFFEATKRVDLTDLTADINVVTPIKNFPTQTLTNHDHLSEARDNRSTVFLNHSDSLPQLPTETLNDLTELHSLLLLTRRCKQEGHYLRQSLWRFYTLLLKRYQISVKDRRTIICQLILPIVIVLIMTFLTFFLTENQFAPIALHIDTLSTYPYTKLLPQHVVLGTNDISNPYDSLFSNCDKNWEVHKEYFDSFIAMDHNISRLHSGVPQYSALYANPSNMSDVDWVLWYNTAFRDSLPTTLNMITECKLRKTNPNAKLIIRNHPLPRAVLLGQVLSRVSVLLWVVMGISFVPAAAGMVVVSERNQLSKHAQHMNGVPVWMYWLSTYIWDLLIYFITAFFIFIVLVGFSVDVVNPDRFGQFCLAITGFGLSVFPFVYLSTLFFKSPYTCQLLTMGLGFSVPLILSVLHIATPAQAFWENQLKYYFLWIPFVSLSQILLYLSWASIDDVDVNNIEWVFLFLPSIFFFIIIIILDGKQFYLSIFTILQSCQRRWIRHMKYCTHRCSQCCPRTHRYFFSSKNQHHTQEPFSGPMSLTNETVIKSLVLNKNALVDGDIENISKSSSCVYTQHGIQEHKIQHTDARSIVSKRFSECCSEHSIKNTENNPILLSKNIIEESEHDMLIQLSGVTKSYKRSKNRFFKCCCLSRNCVSSSLVLDNIWLDLHKGECLGLLGMNGSGKSTLLKLLVGLTRPTKGIATVCGYDTVKNSQASWKHIAMCPQFDYLWDTLTVRETIQFYGRLGGAWGENNEALVFLLVKILGLNDSLDKLVGLLSLGNRRKLSVGIALLSDPTVLLLDEPTSSVDPVSRRALWPILTALVATAPIGGDDIQSQRGTILATHSMQECEALCDTVVILREGRIVASGDIPSLKEQFGNEYELFIELKDDTALIDYKIDNDELLIENNQNVEDNQSVPLLLDDLTKSKKEHFCHYITQKFPGARLIFNFGNDQTWEIPKSTTTLSNLLLSIIKIQKIFGILSLGVSERSLESVFIALQTQLT